MQMRKGNRHGKNQKEIKNAAELDFIFHLYLAAINFVLSIEDSQEQ